MIEKYIEIGTRIYVYVRIGFLALGTAQRNRRYCREGKCGRKEAAAEVKKAWWAGCQIRLPRIQWGA